MTAAPQGLNLEKVRYKRKSVESSSPTLEKSVAAASTDLAKGQSELPKYGFVEMLQQAFGVNDLLEKNRFLNKVRYFKHYIILYFLLIASLL